MLHIRTNYLNVYLFSGLTIQANMYYKMLISWTSQKIKDTYSTHNAFDFKNGNFHIFISNFLSEVLKFRLVSIMHSYVHSALTSVHTVPFLFLLNFTTIP